MTTNMTSNLENTDTQMDGDSLIISEQRKQELKQLFPNAFTETKNDQGDVVETLDFERLKAELGEFSEIYDNRRERYGMDWPGKRDCLRLIQEPSTATLKPCREESVDFDTTENLFIEGDNLEVLKLLQKSYYGKVKMIYIDPPYNTGKEFIYPDNFSESLDTYLEYAGLKEAEGEGRKWSSNSQNEGRFHTKWLNMMFPRLYLARNLLKEDGVIFISIDDNEVENLRRMCDEIFGEENFVAQFVWQKKYSRDNRPLIGTVHEYILLYTRNVNEFSKVRNLLPPSEESLKVYKNLNNDPKGRWRPIPMTAQAGHATKSQFYEVITPTGAKHTPPEGRCWAVSEARYKELLAEGRIYFGKDDSGQPNVIRYMSEIEGFVPWTWLPSKEVGHTDSAMKEFYSLLGKDLAFETPKPKELLKLLGNIALKDDDLALDFFSGTATFGQSLFELSKEKKENYRWILVQLPEPIDHEEHNTIADIGKERIRRSGSNIRNETEGQLNLENKKAIDFGFKVLKLDQSNFKQWQAPDKEISDVDFIKQMELNVDHIDPNANQEDLLYELLIKAGVMPTESIVQLELANHKLFSVAEDSLLIHLDNDIDQDLIDAVIEKAPGQFICLDKAFHGNDQLKANAVKTIQAFNQGKDEVDRIDFKTV